MTALHIYLNSEDTGNHFEPRHFEPFGKKFPDCELIFHLDQASLLRALPDIEWLDTWYFESSWYEKAPKLKVIFTPAAGKNWVQPDPSTKQPVEIYHGKFHGPMIAETLLGLMLHFSRSMPRMLDLQINKQWDRNAQQQNRLLANQTALILGYGNIGKSCGRLLKSLGMNVLGVQRRHKTGVDAETGVSYAHIDDLSRHLPEADHVVLLLPGNDDTHHFMSRERLTSMKASAHIYNFGRGTTIKENDLLWALNKGLIAGAGLDVTEIEPLPTASPLWSHPRVVVLPHSSCVFIEYQSLHVNELIKQIEHRHGKF